MNSREKNLRFKIAFTETNIRWLLGGDPVNHQLIEKHRQAIKQAEQELKQLQN